MHLIIEESLVSELPALLPMMLEAWPGMSALVSSASLSDCLTAIDNGTADAALVRIQGLNSTEIGKLSALAFPTSLDGTMLLHRAGRRAEMIARLRDVAEARGPRESG